jgi:hypothetical protein
MVPHSISTFSLALALTNRVAYAHDAGHGSHGHTAPTFDAGEPANSSSLSRRIELIATEADRKKSFTAASVGVKRWQHIELIIKCGGAGP